MKTIPGHQPELGRETECCGLGSADAVGGWGEAWFVFSFLVKLLFLDYNLVPVPQFVPSLFVNLGLFSFI